MARHFKVHELLTRDQLDELESLAREPATTAAQCFAWLRERGHELSDSSVERWLADFRIRDRVGAAIDASRQFLAAGAKGATDIAAANHLRLQHLLSEALMRCDELTPADAAKIAMALRVGMSAQRDIDELREKFEAAIAQATQAKPDRKLTADDLAEVGRAIFG